MSQKKPVKAKENSCGIYHTHKQTDIKPTLLSHSTSQELKKNSIRCSKVAFTVLGKKS